MGRYSNAPRSARKYFVNNSLKGWRGDSEGHRLAALGIRVRRRDALSEFEGSSRLSRGSESVDVGSSSGSALAPTSTGAGSPDIFLPPVRLEPAKGGVVGTPGVPPPPTSISESGGGF